MIASIRRAVLILTLFVLLVPVLPAQLVRAATTYYVGTLTDDNGANTVHCADPNNVDCSLRSAVKVATSGADTIRWTSISTGLSVLTNGTIALTHAVTIRGPGAGVVQLSGGGAAPVFTVDISANATISGLTIEFGKATTDDGSGNLVGGGIVNFGTLALADCIISGNRVQGPAGGVGANTAGLGGAGGFGGGLANVNGTLTVSNTTFGGKLATGGAGGTGQAGGGGGGAGFGGALYVAGGNISITGSTFAGNSATGGPGGDGSAGGGGGGLGGALFILGGNVLVANSTFSGNTAAGGVGGGAVSSGGISSVGSDGGFGGGGGAGLNSGGAGGFGGGGGGSLNHAGAGGFAGGGGSNSGSGGYQAGVGGFGSGGGGGAAGIGGAVFAYGPATIFVLRAVTISGNSAVGGAGRGTGGAGAGAAGGIYRTSGLHGDPTSGTSYLDTTLVAKNSASVNPDLDGAFTGTFALVGDGTGATGIANGANNNQVGTSAAPIAPRLGALGNYGGSTQTLALLPSSPAIDAGGQCAAGVGQDQRGTTRPQGSACDIGAFESKGFQLNIAGGNSQSVSTNSPFPQPLQVTVANSSGEPVQGGLVTFTAPPSGASATLSGATATIDGQGHATVTATANGTAGTYIVGATTNGASSVTFSLTNVLIAVTPATLPGGALKEAYAQTLSAKGGMVPYTFAVSAGTLPPGLTLDPATGALSGPLTTAGSFSFTVTATDKNGFTGSQAYTVTVTGIATETYTVGTTSDTTAAASTTDCLTATNTNCRLRDAIQYATSGTDTIVFRNGLTGTIMLANGTLTLAANITIQGPGANLLAVDGGCTGCEPGGTPSGGVRVFAVNSGVRVALSGLTIQHGYTVQSSLGGFGGGLYNAGTLTVTDCAFVNNASPAQGGAIYNLISQTATIARSTISGNSAASGGGIFNNGTMTIVNSTLSGNRTGVDRGGGIATVRSLTVTNGTITGNHAGTSGGGIDVLSGSLTLGNTVLAGNAGSDIVFDNLANSVVTDAGHNLIGTSPDYAFSGPGDLVGADPALAPLGTNGGPTPTMALTPTSPVIDAGDDAICAATGAGAVNGKDQRGTSRPQGAHCDIGAYEYVPVTPTIATLAPTTLTTVGGALTIAGTGFQTGTTVALGGGTPIVPTTIAAGGASLTVTLPAHTAGSVPLLVTNPGNLSAASTIPYTPVIGTLSVTSGVAGGGTTVTITGTGFAAGSTSVTFGTATATVTNVTATQIDVTTPAHAAGSVDVTVTVNGQSATKVGAYQYLPIALMIASFSPTSLPVTGGTVTITGTGFLTGATVTLDGGTPIAPTNIAADGTALTVTLPAHAAGSVSVTVTNPGNVSTAAAIPYTLVVASVSPGSGAASGGGVVTIVGAGFVAGSTTVMFGTTSVTIKGITPTQLSVTVPAHAAGTVDVTVTVNGQSVTKVGAYTYGAVNPLPTQAPPGGTTDGPPKPLPGSRTTGATPGSATAPKPLPSSR